MTDTQDVDAIIAKLGGPDTAARTLGVGTEALRKWRQGRAIPTRHWAAVIAATGLTYADLAGRPAAEGPPDGATAALVLADGSVFWGCGFGALNREAAVGEVCFSTGMTGYQETLTDASFAGQIITFTFPHIGNVGTNTEDLEAADVAARGLVVNRDVTAPANWRSTQPLDAWLRGHGVAASPASTPGALTPPHPRLGRARCGRLLSSPRGPGATSTRPRVGRHRRHRGPALDGVDLVREVSCKQTPEWDETLWAWPHGGARQTAPRHHVVAVRLRGIKRATS